MRILIIRNFPSYMDVENNTYNIQEVGLAKALVRKGHICDIIFWTDKEEKDVVLLVDNKWSVHVFYRKGKIRFIQIVKNYLKIMIFCNLVNTIRFSRGFWLKNIRKRL